MGLWRSLLRRLGYARLRDYNLRATSDGMLVPVSSQVPVPIDLSNMGLPWPATPPPPPRRIADGSCDDLQPVTRPPLQAQPPRWHRPPDRVPPAPQPPPAFDDDDTEIVEAPPWFEPPSRRG